MPGASGALGPGRGLSERPGALARCAVADAVRGGGGRREGALGPGSGERKALGALKAAGTSGSLFDAAVLPSRCTAPQHVLMTPTLTAVDSTCYTRFFLPP